MRGRRKRKSVAVTLKSASLERMSGIGYGKGGIKGVKSLSLKEGANYQLWLLGSFTLVLSLTFTLTFLCRTGVPPNLEPAL